MELFRLFGSIFVNDRDAVNSMNNMDNRGKGLASKMGGYFGKIAKASAVMGVGIASALGVKAVKGAVDFEDEMQNVATLLDGDVTKRIGELKDEVKDLQKETGTSSSLLTDGLYQVISAFGDTADSMKILETATKGAKAGNAEVVDSINLLSAVTKGYGDTSAEAVNKASDLAFLTVKLGQTTFPELASAMGKVIPLASSMKVSQEELFGAMATLTGVTGTASEVTTQLRGTIQAFVKPSKEMSETVSALGYASADAMLQEEGLMGSLMALNEATGGSTSEMASLFGSVEAVNSVLALTGEQYDIMTEKTKKMYEAVGSTEEAYKRKSDSVKAMVNILKENFNVLLVSLGEKVLPKLVEFLTWVMDKLPLIEGIFKTAFLSISQAFELVRTAITKVIGDFITKYGELFTNVKDILTNIISFMDNVFRQDVSTTIQALSDKFYQIFGIDISEILTDLVAYITNKINRIRGIITDLSNFVMSIFKGEFTTALEYLKDMFYYIFDEKIADTLGKFIDFLTMWIGDHILPLVEWLVHDVVSWFADTLYPNIKSVWDAVSEFIGVVLDAIKEKVDKFIEIVTYIWERYGENLTQMVKNVWELIKGIIEGVLKIIQGIFKVFTGIFTGDWDKVWTGVKDIFSGVWTNIASIFEYALNQLIEAFKMFGKLLWDTVTMVFNKVKEIIEGIINGVVSWVSDKINGMLESITGVFKSISKAKDNVSNFVNSAKDKIAGVFKKDEPDENADGTSHYRGGMTWVGERGAELVELPAGARIHPSHSTMGMMNALNKGGGSGFESANIILQLDGRTIAKAVGEPLVKEIRLRTGLKI